MLIFIYKIKAKKQNKSMAHIIFLAWQNIGTSYVIPMTEKTRRVSTFWTRQGAALNSN